MVHHQSCVRRQNHQSVVGIGVMNELRHVVQAVWNDKGEVGTTAGRPLCHSGMHFNKAVKRTLAQLIESTEVGREILSGARLSRR